MLRIRSWLLLPWLLAGCMLPLNAAVRDWARSADAAITREQAPPSSRAMQQALSTYFLALSVLWDGGELEFDEAGFAALPPRMEEAEAREAVIELGRVLRAASEERPPRWLPVQNSGPTPAYEDRRLSNAIHAADPPVQLLLARLSREVQPAAAAPLTSQDGEASDPALRQVALERQARQQRLTAEESAARARHVAALAEVARGHARLASLADRIRQRATEREMLLAEDRLRRIMAGSRPVPAP